MFSTRDGERVVSVEHIEGEDAEEGEGAEAVDDAENGDEDAGNTNGAPQD